MKAVKNTRFKIVGHFGMCILFHIMKRRNRVKRIGIMNIFFTKYIVLIQSKTFGVCIIIFIR